MGSCNNTKAPANLEKPPLFTSGCRPIGSDGGRIFNFNTLHALQRITSSTSAAVPAGNDVKIPKIETESCFGSETETPYLKRTKLSDEDRTLQVHSMPVRERTNDTSFSISRTAEQQVLSYQGSGEEMLKMTSGQSSLVTGEFNLLHGPSPLGLNLRKSPSLLDLIQRRLAENEDEKSDVRDEGGKVNRVSNSASSDKDKLKAANFPALKIRIGTWECTSRYDGDLVAKCYYAKRKLVWEVLDSSLKSKMEVQWSDISGLRASFEEDQPAVLDIELSRPPLFFREINPQPRKHTLWQSTSDFTDGQATICRHHSVQFSVGVLNRHFEKLLQCDIRLKALNKQNRVIVDSCFFDNRNMHIDRQHMMHYQSVRAEHSFQPITTGVANDHLQHAALCNADGVQGPIATVPGLQNDAQISNPNIVDNVKGCFTLERFKTESMQQGLPSHRDIGGVPGVRHNQLSTPSPSSVIDTKGLNECSSSSEAEEVSRRENLSSDLVIGQNMRENPMQFPLLRDGVHFQMSRWTPSPNQIDRLNSPMMQASEKQALNALSLHLLGEPITSITAHPYSLGTGGLDVYDRLGNAGSYSSLHQMYFPEDVILKNEKVGSPHSFLGMEETKLYSQARDSHWNSMVESHVFEMGTSSLTAHGAYPDLVYLPRIASQPQFLEPGLQH